jgi:hypothetical protein
MTLRHKCDVSYNSWFNDGFGCVNGPCLFWGLDPIGLEGLQKILRGRPSREMIPGPPKYKMGMISIDSKIQWENSILELHTLYSQCTRNEQVQRCTLTGYRYFLNMFLQFCLDIHLKLSQPKYSYALQVLQSPSQIKISKSLWFIAWVFCS